MITNVLLVRWHGGWHEVTSAASVAVHGRKEGTLGLGAVQSIPEVERVARQQLEVNADPRTEITAAVEPVDATDTPYVGFRPGDTVTVPTVDGGTTTERVVAMTVSQDENGTLTFAPELRDVLLEERERFAVALKKMANGTLSGTSPVASPIAQIRPKVPSVPHPWRPL